MRTFQTFWQDERASTAIEYALIAGLVAVAVGTSVVALQDSIGLVLFSGCESASCVIERSL
jgi:Flp pilus assembly pilin Flp